MSTLKKLKDLKTFWNEHNLKNNIIQLTQLVDDVISTIPDDDTMTVWDESEELPTIYVKNGSHEDILESAEFLAESLAISSNKRLPDIILFDDESEIIERAIVIGLIPESFISNEREEYVIDISRNRIYLYGIDEFDPDHPDLFDRQYTEKNYMSKAGTKDAVMYFLMKHVGMIWAFPGELGKVIPKHEELSLPIGKENKVHTCWYRNCLRYSRPGRKYGQSGIGQDVLKFNRCWNSPFGDHVHGFKGYFDKYHPMGNPGDPEANNMDLFALQPNGTRGYPLSKNIKMEVGEPRLIQVWMADSVAPVAENNPLQMVIGCGFQDGHSTGHSVDPRAIEWDYVGPDAEMVNLRWEGMSAIYPALTDREVEFANRCAEEFAEVYPHLIEKGWKVAMQAYGPTRPSPKDKMPSSHVFCINVANCMNTRFGPGEWHFVNMTNWCSKGIKCLWRPNVGYGHGHQLGMWMTQVHMVLEMLHLWGENCIGVVPDYWWEHWATQWVLYYAVMRWQVDPEIPVDVIMDQAYKALFEDAWQDIKNYYEATERVIEAHPVHNATFSELLEMWNDEKLEEFQQHINLAKEKVDPSSIVMERINWVEEGLKWSRDILQCIKYQKKYEFPFEVIDDIELATRSNAMEDDSNDVQGWWKHGRGNLFRSQSDYTNGSDYAILMDARPIEEGGDDAQQSRTIMPGTREDWLIVEVDILHVEGDGKLAWVEANPPSGGSWGEKYIQVDSKWLRGDEGWQRFKFFCPGGITMAIRGKIVGQTAVYAMDNLSIKYAHPIDVPTLVDNWNNLVIELQQRQSNFSDPRPIGNAANRGGRIPTLAGAEPLPDDFDLI